MTGADMSDPRSIEQPPWHVSRRLLEEYVGIDLDMARSASVEQHLLACSQCRGALSSIALDDADSVEVLDELWLDVIDAVDRPRPGMVGRLLQRIGVADHVAAVVAATPALRLSWFASIIVTLVFAAANTVRADGSDSLLLVLAPLIPLVGIGTAYGAGVDPLYEVARAAPLPGSRIFLYRSLAVLFSSLPLVLAASFVLRVDGLVAIAVAPSRARPRRCDLGAGHVGTTSARGSSRRGGVAGPAGRRVDAIRDAHRLPLRHDVRVPARRSADLRVDRDRGSRTVHRSPRTVRPARHGTDGGALMAPIEVTDVTKRYGRTTVLEGVSLTIRPGVTGMLGPNGAGKTTLLRIMATVLAPDSGSVRFAERTPTSAAALHDIRLDLGYAPQEPGFYPNFTVFEFIDYLAILKEIDDRRARHDEVRRVIELVGLDDVARRPIRKLSGGMRRRTAIAQALLGSPSLLLLDEPTAGLDPEQRLRFRSVLSQRDEGQAIVLATHQTEDVTALCQQVVVIDHGLVRFDGTPADLAASATGRVWVTDRQDPGALLTWIDGAGRHRHIGDPPDSADLVDPTLEDGYLLLMGRDSRQEHAA